MKTKMLLLVSLVLTVTLKSNAQVANWNTGNCIVPLSSPALLATSGGAYDISEKPNCTQVLWLDATNYMAGFGTYWNNTGPTRPNYMVDIMGTNVGDGVNVRCSTCSPVDAVGISIGGTAIGGSDMFLWHGGDQTSFYGGIQAGFLNSSAGSAGPNNNTIIGYQADEAFGVNGGQNNTAIGSQSLTNNASSNNTAVGYQAEYSNTFNNDNNNTAVGYQALYSNKLVNDPFNVAVGSEALYDNTNGVYNTSTGGQSMQFGTTGSYNVADGWGALIGNTGNDNTAVGAQSGSGNVAEAGNTFLGEGTGLWNGTPSYATAVGYYSQVTTTNQEELGNQNAMVTIGFYFNAPPYPADPTKLEINTEATSPNPPFDITYSVTPPGYVNPGNGGTGWSGFRLDDLTSGSTPGINPGYGVLSVDAEGNVIYIYDMGFGLCSTIYPLPQLPADAGIDLNQHNLFFAGNGPNKTVNNVGIGYNCAVLPAKLSVYQNSGSGVGSTGIYVHNTEPGANFPDHSLGIWSSMITSIPNCLIAPTYNYTAAGVFSAPGINLNPSCEYINPLLPPLPEINYAIYVPHLGGAVSVGYPWFGNISNFLLDINGFGRTAGGIIPSDSVIKRNVRSFYSGLKVIRKLNPIIYQYNGKGGFDTSGRYIGLYAENLSRSGGSYGLVRTEINDTITGDTSSIENIYEEAILYTTVNAVKQVDSTVTANRIADSLAINTGAFGSCSGPTHSMSGNEELSLNNNNLYFQGNGSGNCQQNQVYMGYNCGTLSPAKLTVSQSSGDLTNASQGVLVLNNDYYSGTWQPYTGINSMVSGGWPASNCVANVAGQFMASGTLPLACATSPNNSGWPVTSVYNYAIDILPYGGGENIGFSWGSPYTDNTQLLCVNGGVTSLGYWLPSDSILKTNTAPLKHGLDVIRKMQIISYKYNGKAGIDTSGTHYGLMAQQLERIAPYAVGGMTVRLDTSKSERTAVLKINQDAVIYTAINAIKQVDSTETAHHNADSVLISKLTQKVIRDSVIIINQGERIDSVVNAMQSNQSPGGGNSHSGHKRGSGGDTTTTDVTLTGNGATLYQNKPNPFGAKGTQIKYYLPAGATGATMLFLDIQGNQIKEVPLTQTGFGILNITPDNLSAGIYTYSLIVNGNVVDTMKMMLQK